MNRAVEMDSRGFTLIELMITLVIAAIFLSVGVPSFQDFIANQRARTAAQDIMVALLYARSEAVKRNANVLLSISRDGSNNLQGWAVISDTSKSYSNCTASLTPLECLRIQPARVGINLSGNTSITYHSSGKVSASSSSPFAICVTRAYKRQVRIDSTGSPIIEKTSDICP